MIEGVIGLFGMPRSGTSWLGQVFDSSPEVAYRLEPIFAYAFKDAVDENSTGEQFQAFFEAIHGSQDPFMLQVEKREAGSYPTFETLADPRLLAFKTTRYHNLLEPLLERSPNLKLILLVRHPCGAIHSWLSTPKEFPAGADPREEWRHGRCRNERPEEFWGFEDWKRVTQQHVELERRLPERARIFSYEDLVRDPHGQTRSMFEFCGLVVGSQTAAFLDASHSRHSDDQHAVFKDRAVADRWRRELDSSIRDEILADLRGGGLARFIDEPA